MSYGTEEEKKCVAEYELEDLKTAGLLKKFQPAQVSNANVHVSVTVKDCSRLFFTCHHIYQSSKVRLAPFLTLLHPLY